MSTHLAPEIATHIDAIAAALRGDGCLVLPDFLPASQCDELFADCQQRRAEFVEAAVGRGSARRQLRDQRRDATLWLRENVAVQRDFLQAMDSLRGELNRRLYLGLRDYEAHYAHYAPGAFYRRHRDAFAQVRADVGTLKGINSPQRILTSVFYLNTNERGGELVLFSNGRDERELVRIAPVAGTAAFFLSAEFPHEVLPAQSDRYSIAGWFRG